MKIHEYQAKEILKKFGVPIPKGRPVFSIDEAEAAAKSLIAETDNEFVVVKAQIHAGGRGKGGGVKVVKGAAAARETAQKILGMNLVTHQTGPGGQMVKRLLVEQAVDIARELYLGVVVDRGFGRVVVMASSEGGMEIEEVAAKPPGEDPQARSSTRPWAWRRTRRATWPMGSGLHGAAAKNAAELLLLVYNAFVATRCVADRDQPAGRADRRARAGARRQGDLRRQRALPPEGPARRCAISTRRTRPRSRPSGTTCRSSSSTATSAAWSTAPASPWRRWTSSSTSAASRRTSSTSAAAPRREGDGGLQDHHRRPEREGHLRQHLRRHHEVRHHRGRRHRGGQAGRPQGAARRAARRAPTSSSARRCSPSRAWRSRPPTTWPTARKKIVAARARGASSHVGPRRKRDQAHRPGHHRLGRDLPRQADARVRHQRRRRRHARQGRARRTKGSPCSTPSPTPSRRPAPTRPSSTCRRPAPPTRSSRPRDAGIAVVVCITEGIPTLDMVRAQARARRARLEA